MTLDGAPGSRLERVRRNKERASDFFAAVATAGEVTAWGDAEGLLPWEDEGGDILIPLWPGREAAWAENEADAEEGEGPVAIPLTDLARRLRRWEEQGVYGVAVHPVAGHIAATLTVKEFARRLLAEDDRATGILASEARASLLALAPPLP